MTQTKQAFRLTTEQFSQFFDALRQAFRLYAPTRFEKRGRFSDTDCIRYADIQTPDELEWRIKSDFSPKEAVFPVNQSLFQFVNGAWIEPATDDRPVLVFLRACDINGMDRLDTMFLENGGVRDPYYDRFRANVHFVLLECQQSFDTCFCMSMGTNTTDNYEMALRIHEDGAAEALIRGDDLRQRIPADAETSAFAPTFPTRDGSPVELPPLDALTDAICDDDFFDHPLWDDYSQRCIACGRCNFSCPTCSCFTTLDAAYDENPQFGERRRVWAGCHVDKFTDMAGGHQFRKQNGARMRFKTMHKIYDYQRRFGKQMCVGCGRCDDQCPEYISFSTCINTVSRTLKEGR